MQPQSAVGQDGDITSLTEAVPRGSVTPIPPPPPEEAPKVTKKKKPIGCMPKMGAVARIDRGKPGDAPQPSLTPAHTPRLAGATPTDDPPKESTSEATPDKPDPKSNFLKKLMQ